LPKLGYWHVPNREEVEDAGRGFQAEMNSDPHPTRDAFPQAERHIGLGEYQHKPKALPPITRFPSTYLDGS
jgi:hypothetical protein